MAADVLAVPDRFILPSLRALHLDRGSAAAGIAATKESGGERALPLIMTWCPDKGAVNTVGWAALARGRGLANHRGVTCCREGCCYSYEQPSSRPRGGSH